VAVGIKTTTVVGMGVEVSPAAAGIHPSNAIAKMHSTATICIENLLKNRFFEKD
jgi:hypothetical protein